MSKNKDRTRISLDLTPEVHERFRRLQKQAGGITLVEVIRRSMAVYELVMDHGEEVTVTKQDGSTKTYKIL